MKKITNQLSVAERLIIKMKMLLIPILLLVVGNVVGQTTIVNYDFNSGTSFAALTPALSTNVTSTITSTEVFSTVGGTATSTGSFTTNSTAGNSITMGNSSGTNVKYFQFQLGGSALSTYSGYKIYFQAQRSAAGATTATIAYSTNGTSFTNFGTTQSATSGSFSECQFDLSTITALNTQSSIYFRILVSGASGGGTFRVDNFQVRATAPAATPLISTTGTLSAVNTTYGTASASPTSFNVSGADMSAGITVTPPAGFQVSTSSTFASGIGTNASPITVGASGTIASTTVYVRLSSTATVAGSPYSGNIVLSSTSATSVNVATASSTVTAKALTISGISASNKVFDGTTTATLSGSAALVGVVNSDVVTLGGAPVATFASSAAGTGIAVTVTGYSISGAGSGNYTLTQPTGLSADITASATPVISSTLTASGIYGTVASTYTITASESPTSYNATGLPAGLSINTTNGQITGTPTAVPGNFNVTISATNGGGTGTATLVYTIAAKTLTIAGAAITTKNYDATTTATVTGTLGTIYGSDDVAFNSGTSAFASADAGSGITVTANCVLTGTTAGYYTLTQPTGLTGTIVGSAPSIPTIGTATGGNAQAAVTFTASTSTGGSSITGYRVTSNPGGFIGTGAASPITVTGLTNGTAYTFSVTATNIIGTSSASGNSNAVTPNIANSTVNPWTSAAAATTWCTAANWSTGAFPTTTQVAQFNDAGTAITSGITFSNCTPTILGIEVTSLRTKALSVGSQSSTAGTLTLTGGIINSTPNVILRNASNFLFEIKPNVSSSGALGLALGNATDNVISVEGTANLTISSIISGAGKNLTLNATNTGDLRLIGLNTYSGTTTVNGSSTGRLRIETVGALPTTSAVAVNNGGRLLFNIAGTHGGTTQSLTFNPNQTANPSLEILTDAAVVWQGTTAINADTRIDATGTAGSLTLSGVVSGSGTLIKHQTGNLILSNVGNTLTGGTQIKSGSLTVNAGSKMGTGALTMSQTSTNNTALNLNENQTVSALSSAFAATAGTQTQVITIASGKSLTVNQSTNTTYGAGTLSTLSSTISGAGGLIKSGSGTLTLTSPNTYTGATSVTAGSLIITRTSTVTYTATITTSGVSIAFAATPADGNYTILTGALSSTATLGTLTGLASGQTASFSASTGVLTLLTPTITGAATATAFTTTYGTFSTPQTFSVSGVGLTADLVATAPTGFEVSADGTTYGATATFAQSSGSASGSLRIRLTATAAVGNYNDLNIVLSSTGLTSVNITTAASGNTVSTKGLTITGVTANNKSYDGTTSATLNTATANYSGLVNSESFSVSGTPTATFTSANVGTAIAVTIGGFTAPSTNYSITQPSATANITAVALTITGLSANNKTYDRTTAATLSGTPDYSGLVNGEVFTVTGTPTATFATANVGTAIAVTIAGYTAPANYSVTQPSATANITAKTLTIASAAAQNKSYDGNTDAVLIGTLSGVIAPDVVTLTLSGTFASSAAGTGIAVTSTSSIGGADVANYELTQPTGLTADISAYPLPVITSSLTASETYGTSAATYTITASNNPTSFNATGLPAGLSINTTTGAITGTPTATPGNYNVTISATNIGGTGAALLVYTVTPKTLTLTTATAAATKVYDGTTAATVSGASISGVFGTDIVTVNASGIYDTKNVGNGKTVTISYGLNGTEAANYTLSSTSSTTTANITALAISTTGATAQNKTYDNTTAATISGTTLVGVLIGDAVTISTTGTFAQATPGAGIVVNSTQTLGGADAANYTVSLPTGLTANISSVALTVTGASATNKTYDASTTATISGAVLNSVVLGDTVNLITTATFDNKNVGTGKTVSIAYALNGADAGKYTLATASATTTANIAAVSLTISGASVTAKTYDGTTTATVIGGTLNGIIGTEVVTYSGTAAYSDANAGLGKTVTTAFVLAGADATNYTLTQPSLTGDINKANQTITFGALAQKYTTDADFNLTATSPTSGINAITYSSATTAVATVTSAGLVDLLTAGTTIITASQASSTNYNSATATQSLVVVVPSFTTGRLVVARIGSGAAAVPTGGAGAPVYLDEYTTTGTPGYSLTIPTATAGNVNRFVASGTSTAESQLNLSADGQYLTIGGYDMALGATVGSTSPRVIARISNYGIVATTPIGLVHTSGFRSVASTDGSRFWTAGNGTGVATIPFAGSTTSVVAPSVVSSASTNLRTASIYGNQLYYSTGSVGSTGTGIIQVGTGTPTASSQTLTNKIGAADPYGYYMVNRGGTNWNCYVGYNNSSGIYKWSSSDDRVTWTAQGSISTTVGVYSIVAQVNGNDVDLYASTPSSIVKLTDTAAYNATITGTVSTIVTAPTNTIFRGLAFAPTLLAPVVTNTVLTASGTVDALFTNYTITAINSPATYNATGLPAGLSIDTATGVISGTPTAAGTFNVTLSAANATGTDSSKTLVITIAKANQVITFGVLAGKDITDPDFNLSATSTSNANPIVYTSSDESIATISGNTVNIVGNTGNVTITASQVGNDNYNVATSVDQILTVSNALATNQTITFAALASATYGDAPISLSATSDSGLAVTFTSSNPAVATVAGNVVTILNVGTTNIIASQGGNNDVNPATNVIQPLIINQKQLTIINAVVTTKTYDNTNTATVTGGTLNGIVGSDAVTFSGTATFNDVNANTNIPVTTTYTLGGAAVAKYTLLQPSLTGTINKAEQVIVFNTIQPKTTFDLDAAISYFSATSGTNTVTFTSSDPSVLSILNPSVGVYNLHVVGEGFATITASQGASGNYNAAPNVNQTIIVRTVLYRNQFTGASICETPGNIAYTAGNTTGTALTRSTMTCNPTANVFNSTTLSATATVNDASYIEFAVAAANGYKINVKSVSFLRQGSGSAPNQMEVRYSTDGFTTSTSWGAAPLTTTTGTTTTWDFADFTTVLDGTVTFRIYPYGTQRADLVTGAAATGGTFRLDDVTIDGNLVQVITWNGTAWSNGTGPTIADEAEINGNYSTATSPAGNGTFSAKKLTINSGLFTVKSGTNLTVADQLVNSVTNTFSNAVQTAGFKIENNGNLIQTATTNTNVGAIVSSRINTSMRRLDYTYWSSPTASATYSLKNFSPLTMSLTSTPQGGASRFYSLSESDNAFVALDPLATYFDASNIAKGFSIRAPNNFPTNGNTSTFNADFIGVPNNGNITIAVTNSGLLKGSNLIGNPYPSAIDALTFLNYTPDNVTYPNAGTIYFWTHTTQNALGSANYASCNLSGVAQATAGGATPNGKIQVGQGFILKKAASSTVVFNNTMRVGNNEGQFFRTAATEKHRIWLNLATDTTPLNQIMVGYIEGTTLGFDDSYDGKLINSGSSIASVIDNENYVIQARPTPFVNTDEVPLNFKAATAGSYTLSIDHVDGLFLGEQNVYLKDKMLNVTHDIKASAYTFTSDQGTFADRFDVVYNNSTLNISTPTFDANSVVVYKDDNSVLNINAGKVVMKNVKIYDVRGRLVYEKSNINSTTTALKDLKAEQEVLLVKITSDDNKVVTKKVVF